MEGPELCHQQKKVTLQNCTFSSLSKDINICHNFFTMEIHLVGMRFVRRDLDRTTSVTADLLAGLRSDAALLVRERHHPLDPFAIGVYVGGERLAYVSASQNRGLARALLVAVGPRPYRFRDVRARGGACIVCTVEFSAAEPAPSPSRPSRETESAPVPGWVREVESRLAAQII